LALIRKLHAEIFSTASQDKSCGISLRGESQPEHWSRLGSLVSIAPLGYR